MTAIPGDRNTLEELLSSRRIPIHANIVLTNRCNLKCLHCYRKSEPLGVELNCSEWAVILNNLRNHGCTFLRITGGEPLLHNDFLEIFRLAYDLGFYIELSTNGTMIDDVISSLDTMRPDRITVSIYGSSNETYRTFCHSTNGFDQMIRNVKMLKSKGMNVRLQTVLNRMNYRDLVEIKSIADEIEVPFHCYRGIRCDTVGRDNYDLNIEPEEFLESLRIIGDKERCVSHIINSSNQWSDGYKYCTAGLCVCNIDPYGNMYLCNQDTEKKISLLTNDFETCWSYMLVSRREDIEKVNECCNCECRGLCGLCNPAYTKEVKSPDFNKQCSRNKEIFRRLMNENE